MSNRHDILTALVDNLKSINGASPYIARIHPNNVTSKLVFWDEINDWPYVVVSLDSESREYLPAGFKWGYLNIKIMVYTNSNNSPVELEDILQDVETVLDSNLNMEYGLNGRRVQDIQLLNITTDGGLLYPHGVGEIIVQIRYSL